ncbi:26004_t:CDS:2, partial [Gigaspora margarita]
FEQLNDQFDNAFNAYINATSKPRPTYTIPRPTYKEGYAVETSMRSPAHYDLPNRRRNLPVHPKLDVGTKFDQKNIDALKDIEKVAEMDHMDKMFESEDVKVLDEEYYTEKAPNNELLGILWNEYSSPTVCLDNMKEIQTQEINPEEEPLEPKLGPSLVEVLDESDDEILVGDNSRRKEEKNINRAKRPLEEETLHHACTEWMKKVDNFWMTISKKRKSTQTKTAKEMSHIHSYCQNKVEARADKNKVKYHCELGNNTRKKIAVEWYLKDAKNGYANSQFDLGGPYDRYGKSLEKLCRNWKKNDKKKLGKLSLSQYVTNQIKSANLNAEAKAQIHEPKEGSPIWLGLE